MTQPSPPDDATKLRELEAVMAMLAAADWKRIAEGFDK